nr:MAG TPA: hypothetical protein [Caudoviricetes sp.]
MHLVLIKKLPGRMHSISNIDFWYGSKVVKYLLRGGCNR